MSDISWILNHRLRATKYADWAYIPAYRYGIAYVYIQRKGEATYVLALRHPDYPEKLDYGDGPFSTQEMAEPFVSIESAVEAGIAIARVMNLKFSDWFEDLGGINK